MKIKLFIVYVMLAVTVTGWGQSTGSKGLVDSRVTLDTKDLLDAKQNQNGRQQQKSTMPTTQAAPITQSDTIVNVKLPSKIGNTSVTAKIDADSITIGDQTTLHIIVDGLDGKGVGLPTLQELTRGGIEALESKNDTIYDANRKTKSIEQLVTITSFDAGKHSIVGVVVRITDGGQTAMLAPEEGLTLTVAYVADADTTKCETKADTGYLKEPLTFWEIAQWIVYTILLAAIILAVIWVVKRRKEHKPIVVLPGAKPTPADKKALSELEALRRKELWQKGRIKKYYTDMTDIVRRFLRNMYGISAAEMTTRQTLKAFHGIDDWSEESESLLRQLLQKADMVKFAKSQPEAYEHDQAMQYAVDFIRKVAETHKINNPEKEGVK